MKQAFISASYIIQDVYTCYITEMESSHGGACRVSAHPQFFVLPKLCCAQKTLSYLLNI